MKKKNKTTHPIWFLLKGLGFLILGIMIFLPRENDVLWIIKIACGAMFILVAMLYFILAVMFWR